MSKVRQLMATARQSQLRLLITIIPPLKIHICCQSHFSLFFSNVSMSQSSNRVLCSLYMLAKSVHVGINWHIYIHRKLFPPPHRTHFRLMTLEFRRTLSIALHMIIMHSSGWNEEEQARDSVVYKRESCLFKNTSL